MADIIEINQIGDLESYKLTWAALHAETPRASFFSTLEWLQTYWRHFGQKQRLRVLIARSSNRPIGIVPLVIRKEPTRLGTVRVLTYPLDYWGSTYQPLGACQASTLSLAIRHLAATPRDWDLFEPRWVPAQSDLGRLENAMELAGMACRSTPHQTFSTIDYSHYSSWRAYLDSRSAKTRHELRRKQRQLRRGHTVEHIRYRPDPSRAGGGEPAWRLYDECLEIARKSWQAKSTTGNTLCQESVQSFLAEAHEQAAHLGMLDLNLLKVDGQPVAYFYGYHTHGVLTGLRMGYDPSGPKGAGAVLLSMVLEESFQRGDPMIDLGVGAEGFKSKLRTSVTKTYRLSHRAPYAWRVSLLDALRKGRERFRLGAPSSALRMR